MLLIFSACACALWWITTRPLYLGVYTRALASRRLGIPIGSDASAERWSVSSVAVSRTVASLFLPLALWALAGSHSSFCCLLQFPFAHNEQYFAVPTTDHHSGRKGVAAVSPPLEADGVRVVLAMVHWQRIAGYLQSSMEGGGSWAVSIPGVLSSLNPFFPIQKCMILHPVVFGTGCPGGRRVLRLVVLPPVSSGDPGILCSA